MGIQVSLLQVRAHQWWDNVPRLSGPISGSPNSLTRDEGTTDP